MAQPTLFYGGPPGTTYGWGICNRHLIAELSQLTPVVSLTDQHPDWHNPSLPGDLFTPLGNHEFLPVTPARGRRNFAYTFFEAEPTRQSAERAKRYDAIFAGSTWCVERLRAHGIPHGIVLVQGVDGKIFSSRPRPPADGKFRIFSGGKFELRKGQDLVLRAFRALHKKYPDLHLVTAWFNHWPQTMALVARAPDVKFELIPGSWTEQMEHVYRLNDIDPRRVTTLPLLPQAQMADVYAQSDLGLFPNRCEGGTNLVLMEYLACGRPAIATFGTGHRDVVHEKNSLLLRDLRSLVIHGAHREVAARWVEPTVDEIIAQIEHAYHHRTETAVLAHQAAADLQHWSWPRAAKTILAHLT